MASPENDPNLIRLLVDNLEESPIKHEAVCLYQVPKDAVPSETQARVQSVVTVLCTDPNVPMSERQIRTTMRNLEQQSAAVEEALKRTDLQSWADRYNRCSTRANSFIRGMLEERPEKKERRDPYAFLRQTKSWGK